MKRVGYDAQAFLAANGGTGKGVQLRNLIGPFLDQFVGFASAEPNPSGMPLIQEGFAGHTMWQQFSLPGSLRRHGIEVFLAPGNVAPLYLPRRMELILVLHDTIQMQNYSARGMHARFMNAYRRWQIPVSVSRASIVLTVSEHSRQQILQLFPCANVRVIPCTLPERWFDARPLEERAGYLLLVTSSAPHKNAQGAITGYMEYARQAGTATRPLLVVGLAHQAAAYRQELESQGIADLVTFLPFLPEAELLRVYQDAAALLFPSFAEGFGIPMLEAMATGTPVIAARAGSLPEVGAEAACYFDPHSVNELSHALLRVLGDEELRQSMAARGLDRAGVYAPSAVREQVIAFWKEVSGVAPAMSAAA